MKIVTRVYYLKQLELLKDKPLIKIISGIRRSGKTTLLNQFSSTIELESNTNIVKIDFNLKEFSNLQTSDSLHNYILTKYQKNAKNYLFIDEVQMCKNFETAIIDIYTRNLFDIYLTGSNAFLLSSDLATLFGGRYFEIKVYPFSFKEYLDYHGEKDIYNTFNDYINYGGLPGVNVFNDHSQKLSYIKEIAESIVFRDIVQKYNIKNEYALLRIMDFLTDNISNLTSINNITNNLNILDKQNDNKTILSYINYFQKSFYLYKINRYDLCGKEYLKTIQKYYLADHSFKYALNGNKNTDIGKIYENIVAIELLRRGYELYVGKIYDLEVDFIATKQDEKIFIQVSYDITNKETLARETKPFYKIKEFYPKIIIANTRQQTYDIDGIKIFDIRNWLLDKNNFY